jgi:N-glycosylase/DNA lyase
MPQNFKEIKLDLNKTPFNLDYTLSCGQVFRWKKVNVCWLGVLRETVFKIRQASEALCFQSYPKKVDSAIVWSYFRLDDDLPHIFSRIRKDSFIGEAVKRFHGLRLMRQDPWECLISYICATNKNIPAIKDMISNMCMRFGKKILAEDEEFYTFPKPHDLAEASLRELRLCKLGFRSERVKATSKLVSSDTFNLEALKTLPYERAKKELMTLPGVGPKVADCVLLFSLDKLEAFPIDVWMKRIILEYYANRFEPIFVEKAKVKKSPSQREYKTINSFGRKYFGKYVGYAQEYLFHFRRCQLSRVEC